jgi:NAD(P)-dependent dehydrogenase (short-subunit alcohol dehydrogenase family)
MAFHGRVALVTGAASGMGRLSAERLARAGAQVAAVDLHAGPLAELAAAHPTLCAFPCDVADPAAVAALVKEVEAGLGPIDRVTHAAAIAPTGLLAEQPAEEVMRLMRINYGGTVNVALAALPGMLARGRGDLILYASLAGWLPSPWLGAYSATKFAVTAFAEVLHHENRGKGVRFACVCPPVVATPLLDQMGRGARDMIDASPKIEPEEVVDAIEDALERGRFLVFPGRGSSTVWRLRRFLPGLLWRRLHAMAPPR